jgi:basic amino acid/polyamine antiporter, APA family
VEAKKLSPLDATLMVMGGIVGVGIFFTPAHVAAAVGEPWIFVTVWVVGGVAALAGAFTFAELGGSLPREGGWLVYLHEAFGRFPAFLFAWIVLLVVSPGAIAVMLDFFVAQLAVLVPAVGPPRGPVGLGVALAVLGILTAMTLRGIKVSARFQNVCMATKVLAIALLALGAALVLSGPSADVAPLAVVSPRSPWSALAAGLLPVLFTYGGWQMVSYVAPQVEDAPRTLPRAIFVGVVLVAAIYLVANVGYLAALGLSGMAAAAHEGPGLATSLAERAFGPVGGRLLVLGMAVSALGIAVVNVVTTPWMYVTLARQKLFFAGFGELNAHGAPARALYLQLAATAAYLLSGQGDALVSSVSFVEWIFHGLAALALLSLRRSRTDLPRPFASPLYPAAPALYLLIAIGVVCGNLATSIAEERIGSVGIGLAVLAVGALVFWPWSRAMATARLT